MMKAFTHCAAAVVCLFGLSSAEKTCSSGVCLDELNDYASAMQKRSQVVDRSASAILITEDRSGMTEHALSRKIGSGSGSGDVERSTTTKAQRRQAREIEKLEKRYEELNTRLIELIADAAEKHTQVQEAFEGKVLDGVDALRDAASNADSAMLSTHAELVETVGKLEKLLEDKMYTLTVAAGEAKQKLVGAAEDAKDKLQQKVDKAQAAYNAARDSWQLWQDRYEEAQTRMKAKLNDLTEIIKAIQDIVQDKYEVLAQAAEAAQQQASEKLEEAVDAALDEATQKLVDAAVEAEARRVAMLAHYSNVVVDLRKKADQLQARLEEANQKRRELEARAETWAKQIREAAQTTAEKVREAQIEFKNKLQTKIDAVKSLAVSVKRKVEDVKKTAQDIDKKVQDTVKAAINETQSRFYTFTVALKKTQDELKRAATDELKKREAEMISAVAVMEESLKNEVITLETMVVAKVEAKVSEAEAALREAKANADAAAESVKQTADDMKEQAQRAVEDLRKIETQAKNAKEQADVKLREAQEKAKEIETELKKIVANVAEAAENAVQDALSSLTDFFDLFGKRD